MTGAVPACDVGTPDAVFMSRQFGERLSREGQPVSPED